MAGLGRHRKDEFQMEHAAGVFSNRKSKSTNWFGPATGWLGRVADHIIAIGASRDRIRNMQA
jgi:hypothetical protein